MPEVTGGAASFKKNAEHYLVEHKMLLNPAPAGDAINDYAFMHSDASGKDWLQFTPKPTAFAEIKVLEPASRCAGAREIQLVNSALDVGVRYLPYMDDKLTCMKLDAGAKWVFTGPIEGCFVYVVRHNTDTYLFHVNANAVTDKAANALAKDQKLRAAVTALLNGGKILHRLSRDDYLAGPTETQGSRGFVYGRRIGTSGGWDFHYHSIIYDKDNAKALWGSPWLPDDTEMRA